MNTSSPGELDTTIRRGNLRLAWRLRLEFTVDELLKLESACRREFGENWREIVEA